MTEPVCDQWAALIPAEHGVGCTLRVQVSVADDWQAVGLIVLLVGIVLVTALLISQVKR